MNTAYYESLNADLGFEFHLFSLEHPEWMSKNVPQGAVVVLQTDDAGFNSWARELAERVRKSEVPVRPVVLVHIQELQPPHSRIIRAEAELFSTGTNGIHQ